MNESKSDSYANQFKKLKDIFVDNNRKNKNSNFAPIAKEQHPKRTDILYLGASTLSAAIQNLTSNIH